MFSGASQTLCLPNYIVGRTRFQSTEAPQETKRKYFLFLDFYPFHVYISGTEPVD